MSRDPAFLFYSSDFISGVSDLTMEERGQYITLLCLQHQKGHLSKKLIRLSLGNATADVMEKFKIDSDGLFFSKRLDEEIEKRLKHTEKQRERAVEGWKKRKATADATALPLENENENENRNDNKDVKGKGVVGEKEILEMPDDFKPIWNEWLKYRKAKKKKPYADLKYEQIAVNKFLELSKLNSETAKAIVKQTIEGNWEGLYELKSDKNGTTKSTSEIVAGITTSQTAKDFVEGRRASKG